MSIQVSFLSIGCSHFIQAPSFLIATTLLACSSSNDVRIIPALASTFPSHSQCCIGLVLVYFPFLQH